MNIKYSLAVFVLLLSACGERNEEASPLVQTQEQDSMGLSQDVLDRMDTIFELSNGDAQQTMAALASRLIYPENEGFALSATRIASEDQTERTVYECPAGGTVETWETIVPEPNQHLNAYAYDCIVGTLSIRGLFTSISPANVSGDRSFITYTADSYNLRDSRDESLVTWDSGGVRYTFNLETPDDLTSTNWGATFFKVQRPVRSFHVDGPLHRAYFNFNALEFQADYQGLFNERGEAAEIDTVIPFTRESAEASAPFTVGTLTYIGDAVTLVINADTGDDETFLLTISESGSTVTEELEWSERFRFREPSDLQSVDLGF